MLVQRDEFNAKRDAQPYPPIPAAELFQHGSGSGPFWQRPKILHGWGWSTTFNSWSALVTFEDGWYGWTYPKPG